MYKEVVGQTTVMTVLDKRRKTRKGQYAVRVQVFNKGVQKYYKTGVELSLENWEKLAITKSSDLITKKKDIKEYYDMILKHTKDLVLNSSFSFEMLNIKIGKLSGGTLNNSLSVLIESMKEEGRIGTMRYYKDVLVSLEKYAGDDISFDIITPEWLRKYENDSLKKKYTYSTIGMRMRGIRAIMNMAKKDELINDAQYPFGIGKYEIKTGESRKKA